MSLHPHKLPAIPVETRRVVRAVFPKGTLCLHIADELGPIYNDGQFTALTYPHICETSNEINALSSASVRGAKPGASYVKSRLVALSTTAIMADFGHCIIRW